MLFIAKKIFSLTCKKSVLQENFNVLNPYVFQSE